MGTGIEFGGHVTQQAIGAIEAADVDTEPRPIEGYEDSSQRRRQYETWFGDDVEP